jgi:hypothetical protein
MSGERQQAQAGARNACEEPHRLPGGDDVECALCEQHRAVDVVEMARDIRSDGPHEQGPEVARTESARQGVGLVRVRLPRLRAQAGQEGAREVALVRRHEGTQEANTIGVFGASPAPTRRVLASSSRLGAMTIGQTPVV